MKRTNSLIRLFSLILALTLVAAMAFALVSCGNTSSNGADTSSQSDTSEQKAEITITVQVKGSDGNVANFVITTSSEFLRGALEQENLIEGDESEYGLYVKVVNGERADYDEDGAYWSFYKDGEYLMTGVDTTPISDGDVFSIEYTKG